MYTNAGILAMMNLSDIATTHDSLREYLARVEREQIPISQAQYEGMVKWLEDIGDHFVRLAEARGMTNVSGSTMKF